MTVVSRWCFTINNYTDDDIKALDKLDYKYLIYGYEISKSGTEHLQGFFILRKTCRMSAIKKILPRAHLEHARGTDEEAIHYCQKDGKYVELGSRDECGRGKRSDLNLARKASFK